MSRRAQLFISAIAIAGGLVGCGQDEPRTLAPTEPAPQAIPAAALLTVPFTQEEFASQLAQHYATAVHLCSSELERGSDEQVKALAHRLRSELQLQRDALERLVHRYSAGHANPSEQSKQQPNAAARQLGNSPSRNLDRAYLASMIQHHRQGIQFAEEGLRTVMDVELRQMVETGLRDKRVQLSELESLLAGIRQ